MEQVLKCTRAKADSRGVKGEVYGYVPYWPVKKGEARRNSGSAAWKWALLGLLIAGAGAI